MKSMSKQPVKYTRCYTCKKQVPSKQTSTIAGHAKCDTCVDKAYKRHFPETK
jgi:hypothetical protein